MKHYFCLKLLDNHVTLFVETCMHTSRSLNRMAGIMKSLTFITFTVPEKLFTKSFLVVLATPWLAAKPSTQPNTDHYADSLLHESQQQNINLHKNNACIYKTVTVYWKRIWTGLKGRQTLSTSSRRQKGRKARTDTRGCTQTHGCLQNCVKNSPTQTSESS